MTQSCPTAKLKELPKFYSTAALAGSIGETPCKGKTEAQAHSSLYEISDSVCYAEIITRNN